MSRSFCPSSRSIPTSSSADFVGGHSTAVLHATSDFDKVVRRHNRNAFTYLGKSMSSQQQHHNTSRSGVNLSVRLSPIHQRRSHTSQDAPQQVHATQSDVEEVTTRPSSAQVAASSFDAAHPRALATTFGDHVTFVLTQQADVHSAVTDQAQPSSFASLAQLHHEDSSVSLLSANPTASMGSFHRQPYTANKYYSTSDAQLSRCESVVSPQFDGTYFPHNRVRPRTYLNTTIGFAKDYTEERKRYESRTDVEMHQELIHESSFWRANINDDAVVARSNSPLRPGDSIAHTIENSKKLANSKFLTKVRQYMASVEVMMEQENEASRKAAEAAAMERKRMSEWASANPFSAGGVLDKTFTNIAKDVVEPKFSSLANRYYSITYRNRQIDIDLKEGFVVKLEHSVFRLQSIMSYNEFVVVYRQFHRYATPNQFLTIAQIPKNGWVFIDKVIKTLITRKIDKNKSGKIQLPDLIKHLFPAMTMPEILIAIPAYEEQYLKFIDKKVYLFLDTIDPDKVNHFGVVFSIVDKQGNGRVTRQEFVDNMPIDRDVSNDELDEIRAFLVDLFDRNARRDMNEKLELVGEPYLDLDNLASALSISRYNIYGGTIM